MSSRPTPNENPSLRLGILAVVAVSLFSVLFARLWFLQVLAADEYQLAADENSVTVVSVSAPRGRILDSNGAVLVDNRASNVVAIDRARLDPDERPAVLARLSTVLDEPADVLAERLDDPTVSRYLPVPVAEDVDERVMVEISEQAELFPAVDVRRVATRLYPHGSLAAHVLGYVGEVNDQELAAAPGTYQLGDLVGKAGVEKTYEDDLRGVDGELRIEVDAANNPVRVVDSRDPVPGHDVVLSLDLQVQQTAEAALAQGLASARGRVFADNKQPLVADAGAVVVLDVKVGTVAALASYPSFDLPALADGVSPAEAAVLFPQDDRTAAFANRALQGQYAPGSTWKLITSLAGLRTGAVTPTTPVRDSGSFSIPGGCRGVGCTFRNAGGASYGTVTLPRAMTVSSDVYYYNLGYRFFSESAAFGRTPMQDMASDLGIGRPTGVPLPGESAGLVITPELRAERYAEHPDLFASGDWFPGDSVNLAIGQGELAITPVQLANAYATFANGGTRFAPNVALRVEERVGEGTRVVRTIPSRVDGHVAIPPEQRDPVLQGMIGVTQDPRGTAFSAFRGWPHERYPIAGKTGTAQADPKQDTALFAAVGPAGDPQYAVTVVMEQAGFGATSAAPVARAVFGRISLLEEPRPVQFGAGGRA